MSVQTLACVADGSSQNPGRHDRFRQFGNEIVDFIVVRAITAPDTASVEVVKTEALRPGYQGLQQPLGRTYMLSCDEIVYFRSHSLLPPLVRSASFSDRTTMPRAPHNGCDRGLSSVFVNPADSPN